MVTEYSIHESTKTRQEYLQKHVYLLLTFSRVRKSKQKCPFALVESPYPSRPRDCTLKNSLCAAQTAPMCGITLVEGNPR
jgi:hypothetical protein